MDKQQAYYNLWSRFNLPAYDENRVPEEATYPYITYQVILGALDGPVYPLATLWDKSTSWSWLDSKLKEITRTIEDMSPIKIDEGYMNVTLAEGNSAERTSDPADSTVIGYRINLGVEFLTKY